MTQLTQQITAAVEYARDNHGDQKRKGSEVTYLCHLLGVASLVLEYGGDEDQAIAGLLHDVIEDCGAQHEPIIRARFGDAVADIVVACTDGTAEDKGSHTNADSKRLNWWARKLAYIKQLQSKPDATLLVSACDKLHNARAIVADLENPIVGMRVFDRFTGGREGTLRYYHSLSEIIQKRGISVAAQLEATVNRMHELSDSAQRIALTDGVYQLKVYDNFHHGDVSEVYWTGLYLSAEEALAAAQAMVLDDLRSTMAGRLEKGDSMAAEEVYERYTMFGEDPVIYGTPTVKFSAWSYAKQMAPVLVSQHLEGVQNG